MLATESVGYKLKICFFNNKVKHFTYDNKYKIKYCFVLKYHVLRYFDNLNLVLQSDFRLKLNLATAPTTPNIFQK